MTHRESLIAALTAAAGLEHSITCLYLFAAFSLKTHPEEGVDWPRLERIRHWKAELLGVAREEMSHHGLVLNLLNLLGGAPHFSQNLFPHPSAHTPPYTSLPLLPFSTEAMKRFSRYEFLHAPMLSEDGMPRERTIGNLYLGIRGLLAEAAEENPRLFIGSAEHQITNKELGISEGQYGIELVRATDLESAQALIDGMLEHDHFERMTAIEEEYAELRREDPSFQPARPVRPNPSVFRQGGGVETILHPCTRLAAALFNEAYETMILLLNRVYGRSAETDAEIDGLIRVGFYPLMTMVIRPLGELLTQMPADDDPKEATAGAPFELPFALSLQPFRRGAWTLAHERLQAVASKGDMLCQQLEKCHESWAKQLMPRFLLLRENLHAISDKFERHLDLRRGYAHLMLEKLIQP